MLVKRVKTKKPIQFAETSDERMEAEILSMLAIPVRLTRLDGQSFFGGFWVLSWRENEGETNHVILRTKDRERYNRAFLRIAALRRAKA
jgi:hypothetical protein